MKTVDSLIEEILRIEERHRRNECYYRFDFSLGNFYDWTLPPEYKRSLLEKKKPEWNTGSDMYYFMINYYEQVTGSLPQVNFQLNNLAVRKLMSCLDIDDKGKRAVAYLFSRCTDISESKRIKNASELKNTEAFRYIIEARNQR